MMIMLGRRIYIMYISFMSLFLPHLYRLADMRALVWIIFNDDDDKKFINILVLTTSSQAQQTCEPWFSMIIMLGRRIYIIYVLVSTSSSQAADMCALVFNDNHEGRRKYNIYHMCPCFYQLPHLHTRQTCAPLFG